MGNRARSGESTAYECDHDVHVWEQSADLQYHDGVHVIQEPRAEPDADESSIYEVRNRGDEEYAMAYQSRLCRYESRRFGLRCLEG